MPGLHRPSFASVGYFIQSLVRVIPIEWAEGVEARVKRKEFCRGQDVAQQIFNLLYHSQFYSAARLSDSMLRKS